VSTVMIVDNDQATARLLQMLLELEGFTVVAVTIGLQAVGQALQTPPDLFVLDYRLDDTDGLQLTTQLRAHPQFAHVPIIMTSGMDVAREAQQVGVNTFLAKPLDPRELLATMRTLLG